ncbi:hypothetical protein H9661_18665 [Clostridium sp. Sa3CVN1]|uniref:TfoX C-terminal domain-containing protein n=1 Tax=Clostridium cibarium TaxID=2762247 RepID=A0ABR8PYY3_9CLOT|nr:hypothetical protein [Clostridium cibarium]
MEIIRIIDRVQIEICRLFNEVGIFTYDELKNIGEEQGWLKTQEIK